MRKYNTRDRYKGLDPEVAELLKQGKMVEGYAWDDDIAHKKKAIIFDYLFDVKYPVMAQLYESQQVSRFKHFEPIINKLKRTTTDVYEIYKAGLTLPVGTPVVCGKPHNYRRYFACFVEDKAYVYNIATDKRLYHWEDIHTLEPVELPENE